MNRRLTIKGASLIAVGALGLVALGALGPVFNPGTAAAEGTIPSWQRQMAAISVAAQQAATDPVGTDAGASDDVRDRITDMMRDHMGITGEQADELAGAMEDRMRSMHGDQVDEMLDYCAQNGGAEGMMGGSGRGGMMGGMMGGWTGEGSADGTGWGGMMGGSGSGSGGGMMGGSGSGYGGGMMGGSGTN